MSAQRPFRFGVMIVRSGGREEWRETARRVEGLGYDVLLIPDHFGKDLPAPIPALVAAAEATTLRLGTLVLANDFRHPAVLATDIAALDVLSEGRVELGLGAGWQQQEYEWLGIPFDPAPVRIARLEESLAILKAFFTEESVTFRGTYYAIADLPARPRPVQRPHPPILVGGGGRLILSLAGRMADIVAVNVTTRPDGPDWSSATPEALAQKVAWVREAAGDRFPQLELSQNVFTLAVTDDRRPAARQAAQYAGLTEEEVLASPFRLIGSVDQICHDLEERRARYGISYITVPDVFMEPFAPIVARLSGKH